LYVFLYVLPFYRDYRKSSPRDSPPEGKKQVGDKKILKYFLKLRIYVGDALV
jgi:hypothetical protein